jgi:hypothetical protein
MKTIWMMAKKAIIPFARFELYANISCEENNL